MDGIEYLHNHGIAHSDIKLDNILLDSNNDVKIADFGMANLYKEGEKLKEYGGCYEYRPPETFQDNSFDPLPADIYSCGVAFYMMVTGDLPFLDDDVTVLFQKI